MLLSSLKRLAPAGLLLLVPALAHAQRPGTPFPFEAAELDDFAQTEAESLDDLVGRAVLVEFFAYW